MRTDRQIRRGLQNKHPPLVTFHLRGQYPLPNLTRDFASIGGSEPTAAGPQRGDAQTVQLAGGDNTNTNKLLESTPLP
jgi:hypothetical protein